jgi:hypothetical protein
MSSPLNRVAVIAALLAGGMTPVLGAVPAVAAPSAPASAGPTISELYGVSCTSSAACTAVGGSGRSDAGGSLIERWNGAKWTIQRAARPAGATSSSLYGVSCTSRTACVAVGNYIRAGSTASLAERWNGRKWSIQRTPKPARARDTQFFGVSCTSLTACIAVGNSNFGASLAERWNGKRWTIQRMPRPAGAIYKFSFLNSVSCTSRTACTAVGETDTGLAFRGKNITYLSLAERWNGKRWTIQRTPRPVAPAERFLYGVLCTSATSCTGVGVTFLKTTFAVVLAERWNGARWTVQPAPSPSSGLPAEFAGVSCPSRTTCVAVGDAYPEGFNLLAERWNGATWAIQPTPKPAREFYAALYGVSCPSRVVCFAVGQSNNGDGSSQVPLAEKWNGVNWTIQRIPS